MKYTIDIKNCLIWIGIIIFCLLFWVKFVFFIINLMNK